MWSAKTTTDIRRYRPRYHIAPLIKRCNSDNGVRVSPRFTADGKCCLGLIMIQRHGQVSLWPALLVSFDLTQNGLVKPERRNVKLLAPVFSFSFFLFIFHSQLNNNWNIIIIIIISTSATTLFLFSDFLFSIRVTVFRLYVGSKMKISKVTRALSKRSGNIWQWVSFLDQKERKKRFIYLTKSGFTFNEVPRVSRGRMRRIGRDREQGREATRIGRSKKQPGRAAIFLNTS